MRHGYNNHYRFKVKNPFLGEGMLVFANGGDPEGSGEEPLSPIEQKYLDDLEIGPEIQDVDYLKRLFPGDDVSAQLERSLAEYQILRGSLVYMDRVNHYMQTLDDTDPDGEGRFPWTITSEKLESTISKLESSVKDLDLGVDDDFFVTLKSREKGEKRQQVINMLALVYEKTSERANEEAQKIHELYAEKYIAEYDKFSKAWDDAPDVYKPYAEAKKHAYGECQKNLREQVKKKIELGDEEGLINMLRAYQNVFDQEQRELDDALEQANNDISVPSLVEKFNKIQDRKTNEFDARHSEFKTKIATIVTKLEALKKSVGESDLDDTEKTVRVKKLEKLIKDYKKKSTESDEFRRNSFSDSSFMMEDAEEGEEPKILTIEDKNGKEINVPKGLKDRLEMLRSGELSPELINVLASGITEEMQSIEGAIDLFVSDVNVNLDDMSKLLDSEASGGPITSPGFNMDMEVVFMSPMDIWTMITSAKESFDRSLERTRQRKVGTVGSKLFRSLENMNFWPFKHFSVIPGDLEKKKTSAENEAVDFYQNDYKSNDDNSVIALMHTARNQDQFKACLNLLAERGRMNWFDPKFLAQMNRFQKILHFDPNQMEKFHANTPKFHKNLSRAIESIYGDSDLFRNLNAQTQSSYDSGKEKFKAELINMSRARGGLQGLAVEMLKEHKQAGASSTVNPQKFEYVIELGVIEGAVQPAEIGLYFLIQAAACGLLPFERLQFLYANKANDIPYLEVFNEGIFNRQVLMEWASIDPIPATFNTLAEYQVPHNFMRWFHTFVMHNPRVRDRVSKVLSGGKKLDSDLVALFIPYGSENSAINFLQIRPDGSHAEEWAINNLSQTQLFTMHNQLAHMEEMDKAQDGKMGPVKGTDELQNMVSGFIKMDSIMEKRYKPSGGKEYVHWSETLKKQEPRSGHFVNNYFWDKDEKKPSGEDKYGTAYDYALQTRAIVSKLNPEIFSILFKTGKVSDAEVAQVVALAKPYYDFGGNPPTTAAAMYDGIAGLVGAIIQKENGDNGRLRALINETKASHNAFYAAHNKKNPKDKWGGKIEFFPPANRPKQEDVNLPKEEPKKESAQAGKNGDWVVT
jgi:hypothetical protein